MSKPFFAMFRVISGAPGATPTRNSPAISGRLKGKMCGSSSAIAGGTMNVASSSRVHTCHVMRRYPARILSYRKLMPIDIISRNTALGRINFTVRN